MSSSPISIFDSPKLKTAYLIVSVQSRSAKTYIFSIDKNTGGIYHSGIPYIDIFSSQETALQYLISTYKNVGVDKSNSKGIGQSLIGATIYEEKDTSKKQLVILCVQDHEQITKLFNQPIYKIIEVSYTFFELNPESVISPPAGTCTYFNSYNQLIKSKQIPSKESFLNFDLRNNHFYCPTLDMNSQFPYPQNVISNGTFCWNKRFLIPFEENNCLKSCIIVLQGGIYTYNENSSPSITYVVKRSSMFPGTRYNARGLKVTSSKTVEPANECECELIFSDGTDYYSQTWRRGSPPIFWKTESGLLTASHVLSENASKMTPIYFYQHIIKRFQCSRVHIVSLLSNKEGSKERRFNDAYEQGVRKVLFKYVPNEGEEEENNNDNNNDDEQSVSFNFSRFDINRLLSSLDNKSIAEEFFRTMKEDVNCSNFTKVNIETGKIEGEEDFADLDLNNTCLSQNFQSDDNLPSSDQTTQIVKYLNFPLIPIESTNRQSVIFRFNCADSLDRTNVGTFFYSVLLTSKYAYQKNVASFLSENSNQTEDSDPRWTNPLAYLNQKIIDFLIESFLDSGNIISHLYTDTNAIKSGVIKGTQAINSTVPNSKESQSSTQLFYKIDDFITSFFRRCKNTFTDPVRQHTIEEWTRTFNLKNPRFVIDQQHLALCHSQLDGIDKSSNTIDHSIFETVEKDFVINYGEDVSAMFPEPLFLYQISFLILRRNIDDNITVTLKIGNANRNSPIFFNNLLLPTINDKNNTKNKNINDCYVWVTYNLRKISKYSNMFLIDPESLRPALFVNVRFDCPNKLYKSNIRIGNIKFVVKKPSSAILNQMSNFSNLNPQEASNLIVKLNQKNTDENTANISQHKYILTGVPVTVNGVHLEKRINIIYNKTFSSFKNYFNGSSLSKSGSSFFYKLIHSGSTENYMDLKTLPEMGELIMTMMRWIKYGISDYNKFHEMIKHKANPWVFDLSTRMNSQQDPNKCPFCGKKTDHEEIISKLTSIKDSKNPKNNNPPPSSSSKSNDRELLRKSTVYMPNPVFPMFYIKTINSELILNNKSNVTFLCKECSKYYDDFINYENKKIKSKSHAENPKKSDYMNEFLEDVDDDINENDLGVPGNEDEDDLTAQSNIISHYINNFINISDVSDVQHSYLPVFFNSNFCHFDDIPVPLNLNEMARIFDSPSKTPSDKLAKALYATFLPHNNVSNDENCAHLVGRIAEFSVSFVAPVQPTEIKFLLSEPSKAPFKLIVNVPGIKDNVAFLTNSLNGKQFSYEIRIPKKPNGSIQYVQSIIFKFYPDEESESSKTNELDVTLKMINITGFIEAEQRSSGNNDNDDDDLNIDIIGMDYNSNNNINNNKVADPKPLPKFNMTKNGDWNMCFRNQTFRAPDSFPFNFKVSGMAIAIPQKKLSNIPKSIIVAFYKKNTLVHILPIILPSEVSDMNYMQRGNKTQESGLWITSLFSSPPQMDCFYFPIANVVGDFDNIIVFYVERTTNVNPLNIMFF